MPLREIVVGVDESDGAADALRWAVAEAALHAAAVEVVLAWTLLDQHRSITGERFDPKYGEADAGDALRAYVARVLDAGAAGAVRTSSVCDLPAPALLRAAEDADLLVVGARGLGGFRGLLLGSVSQQCLHHATVPVAIVRAPLAPAEPARVVVAIDGSDTGQRALHWAVDEAAARAADLDVVTAWQLGYAGAVASVGPVTPPDDGAEAAAELLARALDAEDVTGVPTVRTIALHGGPAAAVLEHANGAGLLVVGSRGLGPFKRALLGSVATQISHHAPCPLVVVPAAAG